MSLSIRRFAVAVFALALAWPAAAYMSYGPADMVDEVPVERLLANLNRNPQGLPPAQLWRAIGRVHLIAYVRNAKVLPVVREHPDRLFEGVIDDCAKVDADGYSAEDRTKWPKRQPGERCAARDDDTGPKREVPQSAFENARPQSEHLYSALEAYGRAKALEPRNLRTRLALAYVLDRLLRFSDARDELRFILIDGLTYFPYKTVREQEWRGNETHAELSEAVFHFSLIVESDADKKLIATAKAVLAANPPLRWRS